MEIIQVAGLIGVFLVVFTQLSLPFGIFLPGTSFLLTAGLAASQGHVDITGLVVTAFFGSVLGDAFGYFLGRKYGDRLFAGDNVDRARVFYDKYGGVTVVFARFVHFVRTFVPAMAGAGKMSFSPFVAYSVVGSILWTGAVPYLGYRFGVEMPARVIRYALVFLLVGLIISTVVRYAQERVK